MRRSFTRAFLRAHDRPEGVAEQSGSSYTKTALRNGQGRLGTTARRTSVPIPYVDSFPWSVVIVELSLNWYANLHLARTEHRGEAGTVLGPNNSQPTDEVDVILCDQWQRLRGGRGC